MLTKVEFGDNIDEALGFGCLLDAIIRAVITEITEKSLEFYHLKFRFVYPSSIQPLSLFQSAETSLSTKHFLLIVFFNEVLPL